MCGIFGFVGRKKALPFLIKGLLDLEYRGYDSAGVAYVTNKVNIVKTKGKIKSLEKLLDYNTKTYLGIGHTRWATHGIANKTNSHPHKQGKITIVHNGIIENYENLKSELTNYKLKSETDTEILCCLIDKLYCEEKNIIKALNKLKDKVTGSYALAIIIDDDLNSIYVTKKDAPIILCKDDIGSFIASDINAFNDCNKYLLLEDNEIACLTKDDIKIYNSNLEIINKNFKKYDNSYEINSKNNYEHYMLKEIFEQPDAIYNTINSIDNLPNINNYNKIHIVGCGSAYIAGMIGKYFIEKYCNIEVNTYIASEYRYQKCFYDQKTLVIFISQSGETADTLACLKKVKENNIDTLGIINTKSSSIAREVDNVLYTKAGIEIAVATTKAFSSQVITLALLALKNNFNANNITNLINKVLNNKDIFFDIAKKIYKCKNIFYIGRGIDYSLALEGSLKLKEISYIHSEAYAAGELKHGTISLIDKNSYVIAINTDINLHEKTINNLKEIKARKGKVIYITTDTLDITSDFYDEKIIIPTTLDYLQPLLTIIPLQLIAYYVAKLNNCDIDKPKNLAKSVTVE